MITGAKVFSKVDLKAAFNQIRIRKGDEWKTEFITPIGLYEYNSMPFGPANASSTFQSFFNEILFPYLGVFLVVYLDDILIFSKDKIEHEEHLKILFEILKKHQPHIKPEKCKFQMEEIEFLGYNILVGGFAVSLKNIAIQSWLIPKSKKQLKSFLGLANFCRSFIPQFSKIVIPLTEMTYMTRKYERTSKMQESFDNIKEEFKNTAVLLQPDQDNAFFLSTDASDHAMGGMLFQEDITGQLRVVGFYSHNFSTSEQNYDVFDKELLAILNCLRHWRRYLEGTSEPIIIYSDHKNLTTFSTQKKRKQRHHRWEEESNKYHFQIKHVEGISNLIPDILSRKPYLMIDDPDYIVQNSKPIISKDKFISAIIPEILTIHIVFQNNSLNS